MLVSRIWRPLPGFSYFFNLLLLWKLYRPKMLVFDILGMKLINQLPFWCVYEQLGEKNPPDSYFKFNSLWVILISCFLVRSSTRIKHVYTFGTNSGFKAKNTFLICRSCTSWIIQALSARLAHVWDWSSFSAHHISETHSSIPSGFTSLKVRLDTRLLITSFHWLNSGHFTHILHCTFIFEYFHSLCFIESVACFFPSDLFHSS